MATTKRQGRSNQNILFSCIFEVPVVYQNENGGVPKSNHVFFHFPSQMERRLEALEEQLRTSEQVLTSNSFVLKGNKLGVKLPMNLHELPYVDIVLGNKSE